MAEHLTYKRYPNPFNKEAKFAINNIPNGKTVVASPFKKKYKVNNPQRLFHNHQISGEKTHYTALSGS